jgi:integrase
VTTSYNVRIYVLDVYTGKRTTTYWAQWSVDGTRWKEPFKTKALADGFRADLLAAARKGEAFTIETGLPVSMGRKALTSTWYDHAVAFADLKWPRVAATSRRTHAEALTAVTVLMIANDRRRPNAKLIRHALNRWAFNTQRRDSEDCPYEVRTALKWIAENTRQVSDLAKPDVLRAVLDGLTVQLNGQPMAPSVVGRRRRIFGTSVAYAVERGLLVGNPIGPLKWTAPRSNSVIDRRSVANPVQIRTLFDAVREQSNGLRLVAYYGCLYYAALRPEEASGLSLRNLAIPEKGWGDLNLETAEPYAGREWTDSGKNRDRRQLKQRAVGESRKVPCPPELTALLKWHIDTFGTSEDGHLFVGERNRAEMPKGTINRTWRVARRTAFTPEVEASPLARTPYDLRHAAVSTWLNGGVPPADVAAWAGHSVEVLLKIYAKCLDGSQAELRQRVQRALGHI